MNFETEYTYHMLMNDYTHKEYVDELVQQVANKPERSQMVLLSVELEKYVREIIFGSAYNIDFKSELNNYAYMAYQEIDFGTLADTFLDYFLE